MTKGVILPGIIIPPTVATGGKNTHVETPDRPPPHDLKKGDRVHMTYAALPPLTEEEYREGLTMACRYRYPGTVEDAFESDLLTWGIITEYDERGKMILPQREGWLLQCVLVQFDGVWEPANILGCLLLVDAERLEKIPEGK